MSGRELGYPKRCSKRLMDSGDNTRSARLRRLQALREEQEKLEAELHPARGPLPSRWPARGPSTHIATRADVSSRVLAPFLEALAARGGHPSELLQGLRIAATDVSDTVEWLSWEEVGLLSGNLVRAVPEDSLEATGRRVLLHPDIHRLAPLAAVLEDPIALYEFAGHRLFGSAGLLFRCVRFELRAERAGRIHMNVTLPDGYRHNPVFFRLLGAWLAALAGVRGGAPACVSMRAIVGGAVYEIELDEVDYLARREASKPQTPEARNEQLLEVQRLLRERNCELERHDLEREADFRELREAQTRFRILSELTNDY